jgi:hypothetical protein
VILKFKAKEASAKQAPSKSSSAPASISGEEHHTSSEKALEIVKNKSQQDHSLWSTLTPTIEERAIGVFVTNYVLSLHGPSKGHCK